MKVEAEQVEVSYGARKILKEVSINAGEREFVGIIGLMEVVSLRY